MGFNSAFKVLIGVQFHT